MKVLIFFLFTLHMRTLIARGKMQNNQIAFKRNYVIKITIGMCFNETEKRGKYFCYL